MKTRTLYVTSALALATLCQAQEKSTISTELTLDLFSKYVWHGLVTDNEWVLQPGAALEKDGFTFGAWGNLELTDWNQDNYASDPQGKFSEIDVWLEYATTLGGQDVFLGYVDYQFPGTGWERYAEWYAGLEKSFDFADLTLTVFTGDNDFTGTYATLAGSKAINVGHGESLDATLELSYGDSRSNSYLYAYDNAGLSDLHLAVQRSYDIGGGWTATPSLHYSTILNDDMAVGDPHRSNFWFGVSFATSR